MWGTVSQKHRQQRKVKANEEFLAQGSEAQLKRTLRLLATQPGSARRVSGSYRGKN